MIALQMPEAPKLGKSAIICLVALVAIIVGKRLFPAFDFAQTESVILALVTAWVVNLVRESTTTK